MPKKILYVYCPCYVAEAMLEGFEHISETYGVEVTCVRQLDSLLEEVTVDMLEAADLVVRTRFNSLGFPKTPNLKPYQDKVVMVDSSDGRRLFVDVHCSLYLKREYHPWFVEDLKFNPMLLPPPKRNGAIKRIQLLNKTYPFSMCASKVCWEVEPPPWEERDIDVFFVVGMSNSIRVEVDKILNSLTDCGVVMSQCYGGKKGRIPFDQYLGYLRRSKIAVSAYGAGQDCYSYYEIPSCGALLLAQRRTILINNNFVDGKEAIYWDNVEEIPGLIRRLRDDEGTTKEIAAAGREKLLRYHTSYGRVLELLDLAKSKMGIDVLGGVS